MKIVAAFRSKLPEEQFYYRKRLSVTPPLFNHNPSGITGSIADV